MTTDHDDTEDNSLAILWVQEEDQVQIRVDMTLEHLHLIATHLTGHLIAPLSMDTGTDAAEAAIQSFTTTMRELSGGEIHGPAQLNSSRVAEDQAPALAADGSGTWASA